MDISAIIKAIVAPSELQGGDAAANLKPGDKLWGRVVRLETDGRLLIDLGSFRAHALSSVPAKAGDLMRLQVVQTGTPLHLKVETFDGEGAPPLPRMAAATVLSAPEQQRLTGILERLLQDGSGVATRQPLPDAVKTALIQIRELFNPLPIQRPTGDIAAWLRQALEDSGLFLEQKLAEAVISGDVEDASVGSEKPARSQASALPASVSRDAKAQLLTIKTFFSGQDPVAGTMRQVPAKDITFLRNSIERLLTHVEHQQEQFVQKDSGAGNMQVVQHWFVMENLKQPVQLKAYYPRGKSKDAKGGVHRIALLLEMDRLGMLRVDLALFGRQLHIDFFVSEKKVKDEIEDHLQAMDDILMPVFENLVITVRVSDDKIKQFHTEDNAGTDAGRIDIQA